jgi:hypothetical protein
VIISTHQDGFSHLEEVQYLGHLRKKQIYISHSTMELEFIAMAAAGKETE